MPLPWRKRFFLAEVRTGCASFLSAVCTGINTAETLLLVSLKAEILRNGHQPADRTYFSILTLGAIPILPRRSATIACLAAESREPRYTRKWSGKAGGDPRTQASSPSLHNNEKHGAARHLYDRSPTLAESKGAVAKSGRVSTCVSELARGRGGLNLSQHVG